MNEERSAGKPNREEMLEWLDEEIYATAGFLMLAKSGEPWWEKRKAMLHAIRTLIEQSGKVEKSGKPDTPPDTGEGDREKYYHIIKNCPQCGEPTLQSHKGGKARVSREWVENTVRELEKPHTIGYATALLTERLIEIGVEVTRRTK